LDLAACKLECDQVRRIAETEARIRGAIKQRRGAVAEKRADLEAQLAKAEAALRQKKAEVQALQAKAAADRAALARRGAHQGLAGTWPDVEQAEAAAKAAEERLSEMRRQASAKADTERQEAEELRGLYQVYCAATGVRWHPSAEGVEGYVAMDGAARAFAISPSKAAQPMAVADALWQEIEACLPADVAAS